jgi:hypothetical protein
MKKFEYKQVLVYIDMDELNELGKEGWEVIHIVEKVVDKPVYLFKREIPFIETKRTDKQLLQESYKHED